MKVNCNNVYFIGLFGIQIYQLPFPNKRELSLLYSSIYPTYKTIVIHDKCILEINFKEILST